MPDNLDQINVTTRRYIRTNPALVDGIYNQDPLNYFLRQNLKENFDGGSTINEDFLYQSMIGGPYAKGKKFNIAQRQTEQQLRFDIKLAQVSVPLYQEDFQVFNKGGLAAVKLLKARIDQGYMSMGAFVSILTYLNGINAGYTANVNGLTEQLNDGTAGWDGNTYLIDGGLTRAIYAPSLNSTPTQVTGALQYDTVDQAYMRAFYGSGQYEPNLVVTTPIGFSYLKSKFQTQQRFQDTRLEVGVGFRGLSFNGATVVASRYAPGSYLTGPAGAGTADPVATTVLSEMSSPGGGAPSVTVYPVGSLGNSGETLWILNARKPFLNYYVSNDPTFGGGFRDFIPEAASTIVVGQVLLAHQLTVFPRYHNYLWGFSA